MPRGRIKQTPKEAKTESNWRILETLKNHKEGLIFTALKKKTKLHQDTISNRLKDLISSGNVKHDRLNRLYLISEKGKEERDRLWLLDLMEKEKNYAVVGDPGGASVYPAEDLIMKSTMCYAFPTINVVSMLRIKNLVHKYYVLHMLYWLARDYRIDPRCLTGESPIDQLANNLKQVIKSKPQILAFVIDNEEVVKDLNTDYLKEILRIAEVEDKSNIEERALRGKPTYFEKFRQWALELKALEFIQQHKKASLQEIAKNIGSTVKEAEKVLDGLLDYSEPIVMKTHDREGRTIKRVQFWPQKKEFKAGDMTIKIEARKPKAFLKKTIQDSITYYEPLS